MSGSTVVNAVFLAGLAGLFVMDLRRPNQAAGWDLILAGYVAGHVLFFWLVPFNLWDRYFLPLLPLLTLLAGRVAVLIGQVIQHAVARAATRVTSPGAARRWTHAARIMLPLITLAALVPPAVTANYDFSPIGGDHGAFDGIDDAARTDNTQIPSPASDRTRWNVPAGFGCSGRH